MAIAKIADNFDRALVQQIHIRILIQRTLNMNADIGWLHHIPSFDREL